MYILQPLLVHEPIHLLNMHQTMTVRIRQQYPLSETIGLCEPVVDRVYNWEEGDVPKIPCQETILGKEGLNEININSYSKI